MTVGARLKEERVRLGMSQTDFAALSGVKKGTQISWEKDTSSPTVATLTDLARNGVDTVYVLTGRRLPGMVDAHDENIRADLSDIQRDLIDPARQRLADEADDQAEARVIAKAKKELQGIVDHDGPSLPDDLFEHAKALLAAASDPHRLSLLRATDFAEARQRREYEKEMLYIWLEHGEYRPDNSVVELMARIVLEYSVPHRTLVELAQAIHQDVEELNSADRIIRLNEQSKERASEKD